MPVSANHNTRLGRDGAFKNTIVIRVIRNSIQLNLRLHHLPMAFKPRSNRPRVAFRNSEFPAQFLVKLIKKRR